jgi:high-affinity Fe2+/Pb2+ permease
MMSLLTNNPAMVAVIAGVVLVAVVLHVGIYFFIRRIMRSPPVKSSDD